MASLSSFSAQAKPKVVVKYKEYKVKGKNMSEIQRSIRSNGLRSANGMVYSADTDYNMLWSFKFNENTNGCSITAAETTVIITYTMPKMVYDGMEELGTGPQWDAFYNSLKTHEEGHANIAIEAADDIEKAVATQLPAHKTCKEMEAAANALAISLAQKSQNDNIAYDEATHHGETQGALFVANK
jgi:predicted secreted Zn-dependent protease